MRINEPVTQRDMGMDNETEIISTTNLKGALTSVNDDFIKMSGYTWEELENKNHNIIRHPDMPPEGFVMLWDAMKSGNPWMGLVKNRHKSGDHYWVDAYASPQYEDGKIMGYQSVRVKAHDDWIKRADALYNKIMSKKTDDDKRKSRLDEVKLTRFPISFTAKVSIAVSSIFIVCFVGLAIAGQMPLISALISGVIGSALGTVTVYNMLSGLRKIAAESEKVANDPLARFIYTGRNDDLGQIEYSQIFLNAKLRTAIGRVKESSTVLDSAAL
ncbi:MAG: PAS domain-containing protein, partial [Nitrosomonas sp.]|nr:PAS domain-containing protein [Nitrosomonas sp.]